MNLIYSFHSLIRRHLTLLERFLTAAGMSLLLYGLMQSLPVYPLYWDVVLTVAVFALALWAPAAGYFVAILAAVYPLYSISIYIAVIFLAVAVIGQHLFIQNLGGTLLTLASPLLGSIYLVWIIPLLGGLWWGPLGGALMGGLGALWGQLAAGMIGLEPDWVRLFGVLPDLRFLPVRFASANSLDTLLLLLDPLAPNSTALLYHLLQVAIWAFVGWTIGMLAEKEWMQYRRPRSTVVMVAAGSFVLAILHILVNLWLGVIISPNSWFGLGMTALVSAVAAASLEGGLDFFEHPLPLPRKIAFEMEDEAEESPARPVMPPVSSSISEANSEKDKPDDLIMLELD
jgi:hypothetical protein